MDLVRVGDFLDLFVEVDPETEVMVYGADGGFEDPEVLFGPEGVLIT